MNNIDSLWAWRELLHPQTREYELLTWAIEMIRQTGGGINDQAKAGRR